MNTTASATMHGLDAPLPSYETMIVECLQHVTGTRGAAPKEIFNYMTEHWPLIPNFRPSASQALAKALKRGRLLKDGSLYSLNPAWTTGHSTPDPTRPARHIAKKPASSFSHRPPPPIEHTIANEGDNVSREAAPQPTRFSPENKAVAQAIIALLRPIGENIKTLADSQSRDDDPESNLTEDSAVTSGYSHTPTSNNVSTGFAGEVCMSPIPSGSSHGRRDVNSSTRRPSTRAFGWLPSDVIPVEDSEAVSSANETRRRMLDSLEKISARLHERYDT